MASEAEAKKVLNSIYQIRKNEVNLDNLEINKLEHCLSMVHFLAKDYEKVKIWFNFNDLFFVSQKFYFARSSSSLTHFWQKLKPTMK